MKEYILALMQDKRDRIIDLPVRVILLVISLVYGIVIRIIDWTYCKGIRRTYKVSAKVISVGNITLGGTGKTPFTIFLADYFLNKGARPAILTRGYGNDESRMLTDELADVPVIVDQDRVRSARAATEDKRDTIILDDGFQHRRLQRDLDIVLIDSNVFFGNEKMFPRGILREGIAALKRADILVLTKSDMLKEDEINSFKKRLNEMVPDVPVICTKYVCPCLRDVTGALYSPETIKEKKVYVVSGIVNPGYLVFLVNKNGGDVAAEKKYLDHHKYAQSDVLKIYEESKIADVDMIVTTEKDYVKLKDLDISSIEDKLYIFNITVDVVEGKEILTGGLDRIVSG